MTYYDFVKKSLPTDVSLDELKKYGKAKWWIDQPQLAIAYALRHCQRINWQAYYEENPDVKFSGIDPVYHFLNNGIFEGRRLKSWHPLREARDSGASPAPKVSVIIPCYNATSFIEKAVASLLGQTMEDIEIIVVDDCSTDNSLSLARELAARDNRVRVIALPENQGTHLARKAGVREAHGDFIMFLDADDYFSTDACEIAWAAVARGYDIGAFSVRIICHNNLPEKDLIFLDRHFNKGAPGVYDHDLLRQIFIEDGFAYNLAFKICLRELAQAAYSEMSEGRHIVGEDLYAFMVIAHKARNMIRLDDRLYNYSWGLGVSSSREAIGDTAKNAELKQLYQKIFNFCESNSLDNLLEYFRQRNLSRYINQLAFLKGEQFLRVLQECLGAYGPHNTALELMRRFEREPDHIAENLQQLAILPKAGFRKRIGLFYFRLSAGGIETTMKLVCKAISEGNFEPVLFLTERTEYDAEIDPHIKRYYISSFSGSLASRESFLRDLYAAALDARLDYFLYMPLFNEMILWSVALLKLMGIIVLGFLPSDFTIEMLFRGREFRHQSWLKSLRNFASVWCLSISSEIYLRSQGIDAIYFPQAIKKYDSLLPAAPGSKLIAVIARLDDCLKQLYHCLLILADLLKSHKDCQMVFIGDFTDANARRKFDNVLDRYDLRGQVSITGWTDNPGHYLSSARLLLSTSFSEGFPNGIAEAQAMGLPVVMYKLDIMLAKDNPAIIQVDQGDYKAAALAISVLFKDDVSWRKLSSLAMRNANKFTEHRLAANILDFIDNSARQSKINYYTPGQYQAVITDMAFYAGKNWPAL